MKEALNQINKTFTDQLSKVLKIIDFDREYLEMVVSQLEEQEQDLIKANANPHLYPTSQILLLNSLIESGPTQTKYQPIYNQCIVLLVSHFSSVISSLFNETLTYYLKHTETLPEHISNTEYKFRLGELSDLQYNLSGEIGRMIARRSNISFQDMKSISRAFSQFFNVEIPFDKDVANIIGAQAFRHAIVHNGERIDEKCLGQLKSAKDRDVFIDLTLGDDILVDRQDIKTVKNNMLSYVNNLSGNIIETLLG